MYILVSSVSRICLQYQYQLECCYLFSYWLVMNWCKVFLGSCWLTSFGIFLVRWVLDGAASWRGRGNYCDHTCWIRETSSGEHRNFISAPYPRLISCVFMLVIGEVTYCSLPKDETFVDVCTERNVPLFWLVLLIWH